MIERVQIDSRLGDGPSDGVDARANYRLTLQKQRAAIRTGLENAVDPYIGRPPTGDDPSDLVAEIVAAFAEEMADCWYVYSYGFLGDELGLDLPEGKGPADLVNITPVLDDVEFDTDRATVVGKIIMFPELS